MDPNATLQAIASYIANREFGEAVTLIDAYYQWRLKGGAEATNAGDRRASTLAHQLADAIDNAQRIHLS